MSIARIFEVVDVLDFYDQNDGSFFPSSFL